MPYTPLRPTDSDPKNATEIEEENKQSSASAENNEELFKHLSYLS